MASLVTFRATEYVDECFECEHPIVVGDKYTFFGNRVIHAECLADKEVNDTYMSLHGVCPKCHLELPPTRECFCQ